PAVVEVDLGALQLRDRFLALNLLLVASVCLPAQRCPGLFVSRLLGGGLFVGPPLGRLRRDGPVLGAPPLPGDTGHAQGGDQGDQRQQGRDGRPAPRPLDSPLDRRDRAGANGFTVFKAPQVVGQRLGTGVTAGGRLFEALEADCFQVAGDLRLQRPRRHRLGRDHLLQRLQRALCQERRAAPPAPVEGGPPRAPRPRPAPRAAPPPPPPPAPLAAG